jgi:hypothetical protein
VAYTFKHGDRPLEGLTVQRAVGRGGFGEVYYALTDSGKQVALKYLRENPEIELRGISHVMNLKSPYLITIYDVKRNAAGEPFVIMEYVGGPSLRELMLAAPGGLGVQQAAFFLGGIAKGLSYLHERGIVHRDLKPANIFYDDGYVKIGDYGLSKHISVSQHSGQTVSVGTVHYMAPEIGSGNYTKAIDIYALGVILFEMLTGRLPYSGASTAEILMRHLRDNPDLSGVPQPFAAVIAKALAKDPRDRYQTADEMLAAVMESADISRSVEVFDHSALTQAPRSVEASDADATVTSPRPVPLPPLDARDVLRPDYGAARDALPARLQQKLDHLTRKLEQKAERIERKFGPPRYPRPAPPVGAAPPVQRRGQVFILLAVTAAIAVALGLLTIGQGPAESRVAAVGMFLVGGTIGPLLAHLRFLQRSPTRNTLLDRLAYASLGALCMLPGFGLAGGEVSEELARIILAPMAAMLLCDWGQRIEAGRRGKVDGRAAFWPAIIGLVTAHIVDAGDYGWTAAGICAAISLLTQAAASMWPVAKVAAGAPATGKMPVPHEITGETPVPPPATTVPPVQPPVVVQANQPSFVGRTASAGMSFLGKILLLAGLVLALGQGTALKSAQDAIKSGELRVDPDVQRLIEYDFPPGLAFLPLALGSLLLVVARRRQGAMHFFRGFLGCGLMLWSALVAILWANGPLQVLFTTRDLNKLNGPNLWGPVLLITLSLAVGLLLLLWPREDANKTIVV